MPIFDYQIRVLEEKLNQECEGPNTTCKVSMFGAIFDPHFSAFEPE